MEDQVINPSETQAQENPQPQGYQNPAIREEDTAPEKLGGFLGMMLLSLVPVVNLVMFFVWGFGSHNVNRKNFGRAALIVLAIVIVLCFVSSTAIISLLTSLLQNNPVS